MQVQRIKKAGYALGGAHWDLQRLKLNVLQDVYFKCITVRTSIIEWAKISIEAEYNKVFLERHMFIKPTLTGTIVDLG